MEREWWSSFFSPGPPTVCAKNGRSFSKKIYKSWFPERARDLFPRGKFGLQEEELANYKFWRAFTTWPAIPTTRKSEYRKYVRPLGSQSSDLHTLVASLKGGGDWVRFLFFIASSMNGCVVNMWNYLAFFSSTYGSCWRGKRTWAYLIPLPCVFCLQQALVM